MHRPAHSDSGIIERKSGFIRNAFKRYYDLCDVRLHLDLEAAVTSTEVGVLHHLYGQVLQIQYGIAGDASIIDATAGGGTLALCALVHFREARVVALEKDSDRAALLAKNLADMHARLGEDCSAVPRSDALHTTYQAFFAGPTPAVDVLMFTPAWSHDSAGPTVANVLDDVHGIVAHNPRLVLVKVAPNTDISEAQVAFARRAVVHKMVFYGRHAFDVLVLCGPWCREPGEPPCGLEHRVEDIRGHAPRACVFHALTDTPCPPRATGAAPQTPDEISAHNASIRMQTHADAAVAAQPWAGPVPAGLALFDTDIECLARGADAAARMFATMAQENAQHCFVQHADHAYWLGSTEGVSARDAKNTLTRRYSHLHNVITDIEHVIRAVLTLSPAELEPLARIKIARLSGMPLHVENVRRASGPMFMLPLSGTLQLDLAPTLLPADADADTDAVLRLDVPVGTLCLLRGTARHRWAHAMPYGGAGPCYVLFYALAHEPPERFVHDA